MKLAIVGSRGFNDASLLESVLISYKNEITLVVSGGAKGADAMGEFWALSNKIPVKVFKPEWEKYGKSAGMIRNRLIIESCDICIAFWDGKSKGTANSIFMCEKLNKKVEVFRYDN